VFDPFLYFLAVSRQSGRPSLLRSHIGNKEKTTTDDRERERGEQAALLVLLLLSLSVHPADIHRRNRNS
jgi:hypothetical protein